MPGTERPEMRVEGAERETHDDLAGGLRVYLLEHGARIEVRLGAGPIQLDKLGVPAGGVHEFRERAKTALGSRHRWNDGQQWHSKRDVHRSVSVNGPAYNVHILESMLIHVAPGLRCR